MLLSRWRKRAHPTSPVIRYMRWNFPWIPISFLKANLKESLAARIDYSNIRNQKKKEKETVFILFDPPGPVNSNRETRAHPQRSRIWTYSGLALRGHLQVTPGNKCADVVLPVQQYDFCRLCLRISLELNSLEQKHGRKSFSGVWTPRWKR